MKVALLSTDALRTLQLTNDYNMQKDHMMTHTINCLSSQSPYTRVHIFNFWPNPNTEACILKIPFYRSAKLTILAEVELDPSS